MSRIGRYRGTKSSMRASPSAANTRISGSNFHSLDTHPPPPAHTLRKGTETMAKDKLLPILELTGPTLPLVSSHLVKTSASQFPQTCLDCWVGACVIGSFLQKPSFPTWASVGYSLWFCAIQPSSTSALVP